MERKMFDTPILPRLESILAEVKSGDLVVPEFQRQFVWDDDRRLNLLDSIASGIPIGSLLVWRTVKQEIKTYEMIGGIKLDGPRRTGEKINYLIDGHQRISTLFGALYIDERHTTNEGIVDVRWPIYYALGAEKRPAFRVPPRRGVIPDHWLPLNVIFDGDKLYEFTTKLRKKRMKDQAREAERLANIFRDYIIPIVPLVSEDLNVVTDAFVRINSQGKSMSEAHMLRALAYRQIDMDSHFKKVRTQLEPYGWATVEDQVLVNALKAQLDLDVYASDVRGVYQKLVSNQKPLERLGDSMVGAVKCLNRIGVRGPGALPYTYQLITLATLAAELPLPLTDKQYRKTLRKWFWITTYTAFFSGATGSRIREGIRQVADSLKTGNALQWPSTGPVSPIANIQTATGRTRAFLLFLAELPENIEARRRRQEWLGRDNDRTVPSLFADEPSSQPGNRVIASGPELRELRIAIKKGTTTKEMADEFGIPPEALQHGQRRLVEVRNAWFVEQEKAFIKSFGLELSDEL